MNEEITWDDVASDSSYRSTEFIVSPEVINRTVRTRSTDHYEASWLEWFDIDRKTHGQYGSCHHCGYTLMVRFGTKNDAGALGRCRLAMERHTMATHITPDLVKNLGATYTQPVDPPF